MIEEDKGGASEAPQGELNMGIGRPAWYDACILTFIPSAVTGISWDLLIRRTHWNYLLATLLAALIWVLSAIAWWAILIGMENLQSRRNEFDERSTKDKPP